MGRGDWKGREGEWKGKLERNRGAWEWKGRLENEKAKDDSREGGAGGGRRAGMEGIETREKELGTGRGSGLGLYS